MNIGNKRKWLCWAITVGALFWVFHRVPWAQAWGRAVEADLGLLGLAAGLSLIANIWFGCEKYRLILRALGADLSCKEVILLKMGSIPMKALVPMKLGEVARLVYLKRVHGVSWGRGGMSVLLNLACAAVALGILSTGGWILCGQGFGLGALLCFLTLVPLAIITSALVSWPRGFIGWLRQFPGGVALEEALGRLGSKAAAGLLAYSISFEGMKVLNYGVVFLSMGIEPQWDQVLTTVPLLILASSIPLSLMGIGAREVGVLLAFSGWASDESLVGAALWVSMLEGVLPVTAGLFLMRSFLGKLLKEKELLSEDMVGVRRGSSGL